VEEREFWTRLEYRICDEFAGFADRHLRYYWCDGLAPEPCNLDGDEPQISGLAWIGQGHEMEQWHDPLSGYPD
jgi:hypothetical protein